MSKAITFKVMLFRIQNYMGLFQFMMVAYLFIIQTEFNLMLTIVLIIAGCSALAVVDWKFIFPKESKKTAEKNPFNIEMRDYSREMVSRLEKIEAKLDEQHRSGNQ